MIYRAGSRGNKSNKSFKKDSIKVVGASHINEAHKKKQNELKYFYVMSLDM